MATEVHKQPEKYRVLVVDDEPDVHSVTRLSLRGLKFKDREIEMLSAQSGKEAIDIVRGDPGIAVILLDVVMETDSAGLDACRVIRTELANHTVRIMLRTGQPGQAPEKQTIDSYDIDGYLPKAELTSTRLYSAVRAALKSWTELVELERYRRYLSIIHERTVALHSYDPLASTLSRILEAAIEICPSPLGVLELNTVEHDGSPQRYFTHLASGPDSAQASGSAEEVRSRIDRDPQARAATAAQAYAGGVLVPLNVHRELGSGWLYLAEIEADDLARTALALLAGHAGNALYSAVAEKVLAGADEKVDSIAI